MAEISTVNTHRHMTVGFLLLCLSLVFFLWSCGGGTSAPGATEDTTGSTGSASFTIQWHADAADPVSDASADVVSQAIEDCQTAGVASITCTVYDGSHNAIADGGPWDCSDGGASIDLIPVGSNRVFVILGWSGTEGTGNVVYQGQSGTVTIGPGQNSVGTIDAFAFVPTGLTATSPSDSQINLTWSDPGFSRFRIYRADTFLIELTSTGKFSDTGLSQHTQYCYIVSALDDFGNESGRSDQACATTQLLPTWYYDHDRDGYGDHNNATQAANPPAQYVADDTDCNDDNPSINPGQPEFCYDGIDNNCDDAVDDLCAVIRPDSSFTADSNSLVDDANGNEGMPFRASSLLIDEAASYRLCLEFDISSQPLPTKVTLDFQMSNQNAPDFSTISLYHYNANGLVNASDHNQVDLNALITSFSDNGASGPHTYSIDVTDAYLESIRMERIYMGILLKEDDLNNFFARYSVSAPVLNLSY